MLAIFFFQVFQGMMQVTTRSCGSPGTAMRLWISENMRCFYDRLVDDTDRDYFTEELMMVWPVRLCGRVWVLCVVPPCLFACRVQVCTCARRGWGPEDCVIFAMCVVLRVGCCVPYACL